MEGARRWKVSRAQDNGDAIISERLRWLHAARVELLDQVQVGEERLRQFQETVNIQESCLVKRIQLTYEAERVRANGHHQELTERLRRILDTVEKQLAHMEAVATALVAAESLRETRRFLPEEMPLLPELPPPDAVHESWDRVCPPPRWKLARDWTDVEATHRPIDVADAAQACDIMSKPVPVMLDATAWAPQWPAPERAQFKGGTSLPMSTVESESSGPEEMLAGGKSGTPAPWRDAASRLRDDMAKHKTVADAERAALRVSQGIRQRRGHSATQSARQSGAGLAGKARCKDFHRNYEKSLLNSAELNDLIETTAEIEALKWLEQRRSTARARRLLCS